MENLEYVDLKEQEDVLLNHTNNNVDGDITNLEKTNYVKDLFVVLVENANMLQKWNVLKSHNQLKLGVQLEKGFVEEDLYVKLITKQKK
jgi:hypothetical protein